MTEPLKDNWVTGERVQAADMNLIAGRVNELAVGIDSLDADSLTDAGTVGKALVRAVSQAEARERIRAADEAASGAMRNLMSKLIRGVSDAVWLIVGDSTGNETTEWVYLTAQWLASQFPEYTVSYRLWDASGDTDYASATVIQTGTGVANEGGPFTLAIYNASVAGSTVGYFQGSRFSAAIRKNADLLTISHGHNHGGPLSTDNARQYQRNRYLSFVDEASQANPNAGVVCVMQNPKVDNSSGAPSHEFEWQPQKALLYTQAAGWRGWGVVDVMQAFIDYGDWENDLTNADGVHPNSAGSTLWASVFIAALERASKVSSTAQPVPTIAPGRQLIANPEFSAWESTNPDGVSLSVSPPCTASKESTNKETASWAMTLAADSTSGQPYAEWGGTAESLGIKGLLADHTWTAAVRVYVPAANTSTVRVTLQDNNGSAQSCTADVDASCRDRYCWVYVTKTFASNATSLSLRVTPRTSGTAEVSCTVDRIYLYPGAVPFPEGGSAPRVQVGPGSVTLGSGEVQTGAEANMDRLYINGGSFISNHTQVAIFSYFTAKQNITINNLTAFSGSTAAAATPTTVKFAVYSVDPGTGDLTRLGVTTNDTTVFASTFTGYTRALDVPVDLEEGLTYAYAVLQVSSAAVATLIGVPGVGLHNEFFRAPRLSGIITGQTDLASSYSNASVGAKNGVPYLVGTT